MDEQGLRPAQVQDADARARARLEARERMFIRRRVEKKIPKLLSKIEKRMARGLTPEAKVIVSPRLGDKGTSLIAEIVDELLKQAGATGIYYSGLEVPHGNPYVPVVTGIFTWLHVGPNPAKIYY